MPGTQAPRADLAAKTLPAPLYRALRHIFKQNLKGCALVGGTALAGYYAAHRRSDDLDLFARDEPSHRAAVLAVKSLPSTGARNLETTSDTKQYHRSVWELDGHRFTTDVVLDTNLFRVGTFVTTPDGVCVADLRTLLKTKAATLVSRCGEKDLFDLIWLFGKYPDLNFGELIELGREVDGGLNAESVLVSITGTSRSEEACNFALDRKVTRHEIYRRVAKIRRDLVRGLTAHLRNQPAPPLGMLVRALEKSRRKIRTD